MPLSPDARALVHATAQQLLDDAEQLFGEVNAAVTSYAPTAVREDPAFTAEIERSNAAILGHWLAEVLRAPGASIEPVDTADTLDFARDVARRGLEDMTFNYFRVGLEVASRYVMEAAFARSDDPAVLREALAYLLGSSSAYVDRSAALIHQAVADERALLATGARKRRLDTILELLDGTTTDTGTASARLGFELERDLVACILWSETGQANTDELERAARAMADAAGARSALLVPASAAALWVWLPVEREPSSALLAPIAAAAGVRVAIGEVGRGASGLRASHDAAAQTQRVMHRLGSSRHAAGAAEVRVVALAAADEPAASEFIRLTLGELAAAPAAVRDTLRCLVAHAFDTVTVAAVLGVHRNTVLARLRRARQLLPDAQAPRWIDVGLALELDRWLERPGG